jgi:hypothetical protein
MSDLEHLSQQALTIEGQRERAVQRHHMLETELKLGGQLLTCREYADARAAIEQQSQLVEQLTAKARESQAALDTARCQAEAKMRNEVAERTYQSKLAELNSCRADISVTRQTIAKLQNQIPVLEHKQNILLFEIDKARSTLPKEVSA